MGKGFNDFCELVDMSSGIIRPGAPLAAVDRAEVTVLVSPLVPDTHAILLEIQDIGITFQEPEQFMKEGFEVHFFGGE